MNKIPLLALMACLLFLAACAENSSAPPESSDGSEGSMKDREDSGDEPDRPSENQNTDGYEHGTNVEDGKTAVNENTGEYYSKGRVFETQGGENPQVGVELFDQFSTEIYFSPGPEEVKVGDHLTVYYYQNPDGSLKFSRYAPAEKPSKKPAKEACESHSAQSTWLENEKECEWVSEAYCTEMGGVFNECASACRHASGEDFACITLCVPVCTGLG